MRYRTQEREDGRVWAARSGRNDGLPADLRKFLAKLCNLVQIFSTLVLLSADYPLSWKWTQNQSSLLLQTIARTSKTTIEEGKIQVSVLNLEKLHEEEERSCCVGKAGSQWGNRNEATLWKVRKLLISKEVPPSFASIFCYDHGTPAHWRIWSMPKEDPWESFASTGINSSSHIPSSPTLVAGMLVTPVLPLLTYFAWQ